MSYSDEMKTEAKWAEIDLDALSYNMKNIREKVGADVQICAVVKANAYGHSAEDVIGTLKEAGAISSRYQAWMKHWSCVNMNRTGIFSFWETFPTARRNCQ